MQPQLVAIAVTHSSYAHEKDAMANERLEFLGDAVLELVVSEYLFANFPAEPEGELTRRRAMLVCESTLARCAQRLNLGRRCAWDEVKKPKEEDIGRLC